MIDAQTAAKELYRRRKARESISAFADYIDIPAAPISDDDEEETFQIETGKLAKHHKMICDVTQGLIEGTITHEGEVVRNGMLFMPAGAAKSTYGNVVVPSWAIGKYENYNVISTSYGQSLALKQSRKTRQIVKSKKFQNVFGTTILHDNKSVEDWSCENQSSMRAAGILQGVTGNRADLMIIDDPIKGRNEADSETVRNNIKDAIDDDLMTRLKPNGVVLYIMTRWHEDDPAGRLLPEGWDGESGIFRCSDGELYYVISLQAKCDRDDDPLGREIGEYFWPEWFPETHWNRFKSNNRTWSALCQQRPAPDDGDLFKREWVQYYKMLPDNLNIYATRDFAVSDDEGDFTEFTIWGIDFEGNIYFIDNWHGQDNPSVWIDACIDLHFQYKPLKFFGEGGVIRKATEPFLKARKLERKAFFTDEWINPIHNKVINFTSFQGLASMGKVFWPEGCDKAQRGIEQLIKFPAVKHDDFVDTCSQIGRAIDDLALAVIPEEKSNKPRDRWATVFEDDDDDDGWRTA